MAGFIMRQIDRFFRETFDEAKRLGGHGQSEAAAAIFNGNAYVMYGPTQQTKTNEQQQQQPGKEVDGREMGGREI